MELKTYFDNDINNVYQKIMRCRNKFSMTIRDSYKLKKIPDFAGI